MTRGKNFKANFLNYKGIVQNSALPSIPNKGMTSFKKNINNTIDDEKPVT